MFPPSWEEENLLKSSQWEKMENDISYVTTKCSQRIQESYEVGNTPIFQMRKYPKISSK